jgi:manganese-dependent inorganic pyrophosphatase
MTKISVVWHQNPDTDCTLSAIIMCEYLGQKWYEATPYILGGLNKETEYVLEKYNINCPEQVSELDTETQVCLVDHNESSQSV